MRFPLPQLGVLLGACVLLTGCVTRTLSITSEPSGARVFLNDQEVGATPLVVGFTHYGTYDVRLEKEGSRALWTKAEAVQPWWEYPVVDLVAEVTGPKEVRIPWHFKLEPREAAKARDAAALAARAQDMRELNRLPAEDADAKAHEKPAPKTDSRPGAPSGQGSAR